MSTATLSRAMAFLRTFAMRQIKVSESLNFKLCRLDFRVVVSKIRISCESVCLKCVAQASCIARVFRWAHRILGLSPDQCTKMVVNRCHMQGISLWHCNILEHGSAIKAFKCPETRFFFLSTSHFDCYNDRFDILLYIAIWHES